MKKVKSTAILITVIAVMCKLMGFLREIILAHTYGTSYVLDAYLTSTMIPGVYFGWLTSVSISYIPMYFEVQNNKGHKEVDRFTNSLLSLSFIVSLLCVVIGVLFANRLVSISAPGFSGEVYYLTVHYFRIAMLIIVTTVPVKIFTAYLNCNSKFISSNLSTLVISLTQIIVIFISRKVGAEIMIIGVVLADYIQLTILYVFSKKVGYRYRFEIKITKEFKTLLRMTIPVFVSSMFVEISSFFDQIFASYLDEGSISALHYAITVRKFIYYVFSIAITTMIFPILSKSIANNDIVKAKFYLVKCINLIIILFMPITIGAIVLSVPAISFIYQRGEFDINSTMLTVYPFLMYTIGLLPIAIREVITKMFYSIKDTKFVTKVSIVSIFLNIVLNFLLVKNLKHTGLAIASTLSIALILPLLLKELVIKVGNFITKNMVYVFLKSTIASFVMGFLVYILYSYFNNFLCWTNYLSLILCSVLGGVIYFALMLILRVEELLQIKSDIIHIVKKLAKTIK